LIDTKTKRVMLNLIGHVKPMGLGRIGHVELEFGATRPLVRPTRDIHKERKREKKKLLHAGGEIKVGEKHIFSET